jgi:hypothetical protein
MTSEALANLSAMADPESSVEIGSRVFISYKRNVEPDESVAIRLRERLEASHRVFIDQAMLVGTVWAERIESELRSADFLITLLSADSVQSEMVVSEIETAHRLAKSNQGKPVILPVRLMYHEPFVYPLSAYLNHINWAELRSLDELDDVFAEIERVITSGESAWHTPTGVEGSHTPSISGELPAPAAAASLDALDLPEGTMDPGSTFYVRRSADEVIENVIRKTGVTVTIKGPRQMGKSSLLVRTAHLAAQHGKNTAILDFQLFEEDALSHADTFYRQFAAWLSDDLGIPDRTDEHWAVPLGNTQRCTRYMQRYVLPQLSVPLVLGMDELDSLLESDFRSDFFGMLRSWHNARRPGSAWKQLDLVLVTSTEPYQLISHVHQSPFNVGEILELTDFTERDVADLNARHRNPMTVTELDELMRLVGGHPYLIRRALYLVTSGRYSASGLLNDAPNYGGPFGDHLRHHLFRLTGRDDLVTALLQVLRGGSTPDELVLHRLIGAGLLRREGRGVVARCELYHRFFREQLHA